MEKVNNDRMWASIIKHTTLSGIGKLVKKALKDQGLQYNQETKEIESINDDVFLEKGNWYVCIKDVYMNDNKDLKAYTKGSLYKCLADDTLPDDFGNDCHYWGEGSHQETYFRPATPEEMPSSERNLVEAVANEPIEQKPVVPKFRVGDWIIFAENHNSVYQIERLDNYRYYLRHYLGGALSVHFDNELIRHWTINDAKDGDVLVDKYGNIGIYQGDKNAVTWNSCCYCGANKGFYDEGSHEFPCHPATKEQCDLLFQKMHDAGYMWDSTNKKLLSLKAEPELSHSEVTKESVQELTEFESKLRFIIDNNPSGLNFKVLSRELLSIARKQFIKEACKWLYDVWPQVAESPQFIEDFRKALEKGE